MFQWTQHKLSYSSSLCYLYLVASSVWSNFLPKETEPISIAFSLSTFVIGHTLYIGSDSSLGFSLQTHNWFEEEVCGMAREAHVSQRDEPGENCQKCQNRSGVFPNNCFSMSLSMCFQLYLGVLTLFSPSLSLLPLFACVVW